MNAARRRDAACCIMMPCLPWPLKQKRIWKAITIEEALRDLR